MADPGHHKKSVAKHFYKLATAHVGISRVTKGMAKRLKQNWGYTVKQNKGKTIKEFMESAKAPLKHLFGNHIHCKVHWYDALKAQTADKPYNHTVARKLLSHTGRFQFSHGFVAIPLKHLLQWLHGNDDLEFKLRTMKNSDGKYSHVQDMCINNMTYRPT